MAVLGGAAPAHGARDKRAVSAMNPRYRDMARPPPTPTAPGNAGMPSWEGAGSPSHPTLPGQRHPSPGLGHFPRSGGMEIPQKSNLFDIPEYSGLLQHPEGSIRMEKGIIFPFLLWTVTAAGPAAPFPRPSWR